MQGTTDWSAVEPIIREAEATGGSVGVTLVAPNGDTYTHNGDRRLRRRQHGQDSADD